MEKINGNESLARRVLKRIQKVVIPIAASTTPAVLALFSLNVWIAWRLFTMEYADHFNSVEGFFIGISRYIAHHWTGFSWWPLWHGGMPIQNTYAPLFHWSVALLSTLSAMSAFRSHHLLTGLAYALGPVTLYWMLLRLGARKSTAFAIALAYSLFSPAALLVPDVRLDLGGISNALRLRTTVVYGEIAHVTALTILPVVIACLQESLARLRYLAFAAIAVAAVVLTNTPGTAALIFGVFAWVVVQPAGSRARAWLMAAVAGVLGYGIACYGVPLSTLRINFSSITPMHAGFSAYRIPLLFGLMAATAAIGIALARYCVPLAIRYGITLALLVGCIVLTADPRRFELFPQGGRFQLEMEMAICISVIGAIGAWWKRCPSLARRSALVLAAALTIVQIVNYRAHARFELRHANPVTRTEYQVARWLDENMAGQRVFVLGSTSFWLNAFSDSPQFTGCCDQSVNNSWIQAVRYLVPLGDPALAVRWLQAYGVQAIVVTGPGSTDEYSSFPNPQKFEGVLPVCHRTLGATIYRVPQVSTSLAHAIGPDELLTTVPTDFLDPTAGRYLDAIQDGSRPQLQFSWLENSKVRIVGRLRRKDLVMVQASFVPGWVATANGRRIPVRRDGLGLIVLEPGCEENCEILLDWQGPSDFLMMKWISIASTFVAAIVILRERSALSTLARDESVVQPVAALRR